MKIHLPKPSTVKRMTNQAIKSLLRPCTILAKWIWGLCEVKAELEQELKTPGFALQRMPDLELCLSLRALDLLAEKPFELKYLKNEGV